MIDACPFLRWSAAPLLAFALYAGQPMLFVHNGPEAPGDSRYDYHWEVLRAALDATAAKWGAYELREAPYMNETRQITEMRQVEVQPDNGRLNTLVHDDTREFEQTLVPVRIPVDKNLLGYRVFLICKRDRGKFAGINSLKDLQRITIGQGSEWSDVAILREAGFHVITGTSYEGLFDMLDAGRFGAFCRSVTEIEGELAHYGPRHPGMMIEPNLLLYYPMPIYFWFPRTDEGRERARRVEEGMRSLIASGSLDRIFRQRYGNLIRRLGLQHRRVFMIKNALLPANQSQGEVAPRLSPLE